MRITMLGATGGTGRQLVSQALQRGHQVDAVVRDPARAAVSHGRPDMDKTDTSAHTHNGVARPFRALYHRVKGEILS